MEELINMNEGFNCPACGKPLQTATVCETDLEVCLNGCGGIWFDAAELFRFDEQHEGINDPVLQKLLECPTAQVAENGEKRTCIKCGIKMKRHEYREGSGIYVDECYGCGGLWLDGGELKAIRENPAVLQSNQEREVMAKEFSRKVQDEARRRKEEEEARRRRNRHQW